MFPKEDTSESMAKFSLVCVLVVLGLILPCTATTYTVGDSSGWDISTDINAWTAQKRFVVGDALLFQYSSTHNVSEVTRKNYDGCNTTVTQKTYSDGNTTIPLTSAGNKYFICGSKLHCLGGMKLQINVEGNDTNSPTGAPAQSPDSMPIDPSSKSNNPATTILPTSHGFSIHAGFASLLFFSCTCVSTLLWMV